MTTATFYSYKGGVGRTLTLTNLAAVLAQAGANIVLLDFDLEAPGLHYKFGKNGQALEVKKGLVDYIYDYAHQDIIHPVEDFLVPLKIADDQQGQLHLFPAGNTKDPGYWQKLTRIDVQQLLFNKQKQGFAFFLELKARIAQYLKPDFLFIDARTGITEMGGVATTVLAEKVVVVMVNNAENLDGAQHVRQSLQQAKRPSFLPPIDTILLINRVPANDGLAEEEMLKHIAQQLNASASYAIDTDELLIIHSDDSLAWGEKLYLVGGDDALLETQLAQDYVALAMRLIEGLTKGAVPDHLKRAFDLVVRLFTYQKNLAAWNDSWLNENDFSDQDEFIQATITLHPEIIWPRIKLIQLLVKVKRLEKAMTLAEQAERKFPNHSGLKAMFDQLKTKPQEVDSLDRIFDANRLELAKVYQQQKNFKKAEDVLLELLKLDNKNLQARTELAKVYQQQKEFKKAEDVLHEALKINKNDLPTRTELAKVYQQLKDFKKAIQYLQEYIELDPKGLHPRTELAKVYQRLKDFKKAEDVLLELLKLDNKNLQARTELAKVYQQLKDFKKAEDVLLELLKLDNKNLQARTELAKVYQQLKDFKKAIQYLQEYIELDPKGLHPRTELAKVYQQLKDFKKAIQYLQEYIELDPKGLHPRTELAKVYQRLKDFKKAEDVLLEILKLDNKNLQARTELAKVYQQLKDFKKAEDVLLELLKLDNKNLQARTELAKVYQQLKDFKKAEEILLEALKIGQNNTRVKSELARIQQRQ